MIKETVPHEGQILKGPLFDEPMRVETVCEAGGGTWILGLVGVHSERFRKVTLRHEDLGTLAIASPISTYEGDGRLFRLGLQAYSLGIAYEFDPYFGLSLSSVDPLPHQLEAVYEYLLKLARVRFLLADDADAGKTIMAGLLLRELQLRGLAERILVVCPANLAFQWQRELNEKFTEKFEILRGSNIRDQFGMNQWLEKKKIITSLDLAKRDDILPGLGQVQWDLVIVDEAHRMSWTPPSKKTARYALGELLRDTSDHILLLTVTPHKGDPRISACSFSFLTKTLMRMCGRFARPWSVEELHSIFAERRRRWSISLRGSRMAHGQQRRSSRSAFLIPWTSKSTVRSSNSTERLLGSLRCSAQKQRHGVTTLVQEPWAS